MAVCRSQRAVDSLLLGLDDIRFEVRFQCGRSLAAIAAKAAGPAHRCGPCLRRRSEGSRRWPAGVGRPASARSPRRRRIEDVGGRFHQEPRQPESRARVHAFSRSCCRPSRCRSRCAVCMSTIQNLRGTALEYLESVLPPAIRDPLWPFLEDSPSGRQNLARPGRNSGRLGAFESLDYAEPRGARTSDAPAKRDHGSRDAWQNKNSSSCRATRRLRPDGRRRPMAQGTFRTICSPSRSSGSRCSALIGVALWTTGLLMDQVITLTVPTGLPVGCLEAPRPGGDSASIVSAVDVRVRPLLLATHRRPRPM